MERRQTTQNPKINDQVVNFLSFLFASHMPNVVEEASNLEIPSGMNSRSKSPNQSIDRKL